MAVEFEKDTGAVKSSPQGEQGERWKVKQGKFTPRGESNGACKEHGRDEKLEPFLLPLLRTAVTINLSDMDYMQKNKDQQPLWDAKSLSSWIMIA